VGLVERAEIDTQLQGAQNVSLVLFCAPAGFGKTTVMARYFDKQRSNGSPPSGSCWTMPTTTSSDSFSRCKLPSTEAASSLTRCPLEYRGLRRPARGSTWRPAWHRRSTHSRSSSTISNSCATPVVLDLFKEGPGEPSRPRASRAGCARTFEIERRALACDRPHGRNRPREPTILRHRSTGAVGPQERGCRYPNEPWTSSTTAPKDGSPRCNWLL